MRNRSAETNHRILMAQVEREMKELRAQLKLIRVSRDDIKYMSAADVYTARKRRRNLKEKLEQLQIKLDTLNPKNI